MAISLALVNDPFLVLADEPTEGDVDLHGFLEMDDSVPRGYKNIRIKFKIKADVPDEQLEELCQLGPTFSPVFDTVTRAVNVAVGLDQ